MLPAKIKSRLTVQKNENWCRCTVSILYRIVLQDNSIHKKLFRVTVFHYFSCQLLTLRLTNLGHRSFQVPTNARNKRNFDKYHLRHVISRGKNSIVKLKISRRRKCVKLKYKLKTREKWEIWKKNLHFFVYSIDEVNGKTNCDDSAIWHEKKEYVTFSWEKLKWNGCSLFYHE